MAILPHAFAGMTAMSKAAVAEPPPDRVAVTVYVVGGDTTVGVPVMIPVVRLKNRPVGSEGVMAHEVDEPLLRVGVFEVMRAFNW